MKLPGVDYSLRGKDALDECLRGLHLLDLTEDGEDGVGADDAISLTEHALKVGYRMGVDQGYKEFVTIIDDCLVTVERMLIDTGDMHIVLGALRASVVAVIDMMEGGPHAD